MTGDLSTNVVVVGPGLIDQVIARRVGVGKHIVLADVRRDNADGNDILRDDGVTAAYRFGDVAEVR